MPKLILASTSPRRLQLLAQIGYKPDIIIDPNIDEKPGKHEIPSLLVKRLAYEKALVGHKKYPNDITLGADTLVSKGRKVLGKPTNVIEAKAFLDILSGHRHRVYTGISVICNDKVVTKVACTIVKFKHLSEEDKLTYIASNEWEGKAGGYSIQGLANAFITKIMGSDTNVVGLNLNITYKLLTLFNLKPNIL
jgi:septum formation protein